MSTTPDLATITDEQAARLFAAGALLAHVPWDCLAAWRLVDGRHLLLDAEFDGHAVWMLEQTR